MVKTSNANACMNTKHLLSLLSVAAAIVLAFGCVTHKTQADLKAKAKISQAQAQQTALAEAPAGSTVKECELEEEHGKLVWSFDLATPGTEDITEILVDALSGKINAIEKETPAQQESERRAKKQEKR